MNNTNSDCNEKIKQILTIICIFVLIFVFAPQNAVLAQEEELSESLLQDPFPEEAEPPSNTPIPNGGSQGTEGTANDQGFQQVFGGIEISTGFLIVLLLFAMIIAILIIVVVILYVVLKMKRTSF